MKIYIAARFSRRPECNALAHKLMALGHTITHPHFGPAPVQVFAINVEE